MKKKQGKDLKRKLLAYSGLAAGVLAIAPAAEATVVYSGAQNLAVNSSTAPVLIDIDGNGADDFLFGTIGGQGVVMAEDANHSFINSVAYTPFHFGVANLASNYNIQNALAGPKLWSNNYFGILAAVAPYSTMYGNFNRRAGFVGVRFQGNCSPDSFHYGWIRFRGITGVTGTVIDWAYEDTCDTAIRTPALTPVSVPTLTEWGAIGMAGLLAGAAIRTLRKKKTEQE